MLKKIIQFIFSLLNHKTINTIKEQQKDEKSMNIEPTTTVAEDLRNRSNNLEERQAYAKEHGGYYFGNTSWKKLKTCDERIQIIMRELIKFFNISIDCGERNEESQTEAFLSGRSGVQYPNSMHNPDNPKNKGNEGVKAIDVLPYPVDWEDTERFVYMAGMIIWIAHSFGIDLRWGGDWNRDGRMRDDKERKALRDYPHFELYLP